MRKSSKIPEITFPELVRFLTQLPYSQIRDPWTGWIRQILLSFPHDFWDKPDRNLPLQRLRRLWLSGNPLTESQLAFLAETLSGKLKDTLLQTEFYRLLEDQTIEREIQSGENTPGPISGNGGRYRFLFPTQLVSGGFQAETWMRRVRPGNNAPMDHYRWLLQAALPEIDFVFQQSGCGTVQELWRRISLRMLKDARRKFPDLLRELCQEAGRTREDCLPDLQKVHQAILRNAA